MQPIIWHVRPTLFHKETVSWTEIVVQQEIALFMLLQPLSAKTATESVNASTGLQNPGISEITPDSGQWNVGQQHFLAGISPLPVLVQGIRDFGQPRPVLNLFQQF